jgi:hypothetical protein
MAAVQWRAADEVANLADRTGQHPSTMKLLCLIAAFCYGWATEHNVARPSPARGVFTSRDNADGRLTACIDLYCNLNHWPET